MESTDLPHSSLTSQPRSDRSSRRSQAERRNSAERALLEAAARLIARLGIDRTSLADVGELAGYSRGLTNHRFGSKQALLERLAVESQRTVREGLGDFAGADEVQVLIDVASTYLRWMKHDHDQARAFFAMWGSAFAEEGALRPVFGDFDGRFRWEVENVVRTGQRNGTIRTELDPEGVAVAFVGLLRGTGAQFMVDPEAVDLVAASAVCEYFIRQMAAPGSASHSILA